MGFVRISRFFIDIFRSVSQFAALLEKVSLNIEMFLKAEYIVGRNRPSGFITPISIEKQAVWLHHTDINSKLFLEILLKNHCR